MATSSERTATVHHTIIYAALALLIAAFVLHRPALAVATNEFVTVQLRDGRVVVGKVDGQDSGYLSLRSEAPGIQLRSRFPWADIDNIQSPAKVAAAELPASASAETSFTTDAQVVREPGRYDRVQALEIHAQLANWDGDGQVDGVLVTITPLSTEGRAIPVRGTLDLSILAEVGSSSDGRWSSLTPGFRELERSHHAVKVDDFRAGSAVYRLPFNRVQPDFDWGVSTHGIVHARLGVPGEGVFEASDSHVRLRSFSPTRDRMQLFRGDRYFPLENAPRQ